jgi:putative holliday junction resolvase
MRPVLGVDLGQTRTGIAISDELRLLAHPLETITSASAAAVAQRIRQIVSEKNVERIVIGLPRHMNGTFGPSAEKAKQFAGMVRAAISCDVVLWDERLSTKAAHRALRESGKKTRATRNIVDQVAAQFILQGYLDQASVSGSDDIRDSRI